MKFKQGCAGQRNGIITGVMLHNTADNHTAEWWKNYLPNHTAEKGFAHYYIDRNLMFQAELDRNIAWHCGNSAYNRTFLSVEVCESTADREIFLQNEKAAINLIADLCKKYDIVPTNETIKFHCEVRATACPHRTVSEHGGNLEKSKNYILSEIKSKLLFKN
jgi:N-acetylmuramoyl-L-alanine amidase CwlA